MTVQDQVLALLPTLDRDELLRVARLYVENVGYLEEHLPACRERARKFPCVDESYHVCSFTTIHDPGCKAVGGDGDVSANGYKSASSCAPDCDVAGHDEQWCRCSGFDCPECELVDVLLGMIAAHA